MLKFSKTMGMLIMLVAAMFVITACGGGDEAATPSVEGHVNESNFEEFIVVDVFSARANYQGLQTGFFAQIVRELFNMELNIIAPNVAGGGDLLFQTRQAAGHLGDLIVVGAGGGTMQELVTGGLLLDMSPYLDPNGMLMTRFSDAVQNLNSIVTQDGVFGAPMEVSMLPPTAPSEAVEPTFAPFLRWDLYAQLGYPEMHSLDDLLDVLEAMQALEPVTEDGLPVFALSLFPDWDGIYMTASRQPPGFFGYYGGTGYVLMRADGGSIVSMIDEDSIMIDTLRFFNEAFRRGLLDPESATQTWSDVWTKYQNGQVLFSFWPWLGQAAFNTEENVSRGRGFMVAPIEGMRALSIGATPLGQPTLIGIGPNAQDPQRLAAFIDWLYSPEGIKAGGMLGAEVGPEGLTWEMRNGEPHLTDFGIRVLINGEDVPVPDEWGGGNWTDGANQINFPTTTLAEVNPDTGFPYYYALWPSVMRDFGSNPVVDDWRAHTGHMYTMELLRERDMLMVAPGAGFVIPEEPTEIATLRGMIAGVVVPMSWQMVYANSEAEFESLLSQMRERAYGLGLEQVLEFDFANAHYLNALRREIEASYNN